MPRNKARDAVSSAKSCGSCMGKRERSRRRSREAHRPLEDPEGIGPDGGGKVLGLVQVVQRKEAEPNEGVPIQVARVVLAVAKGESKAEKVESKRRRARINQNEHRNVAGETGAYTPDGDLRMCVETSPRIQEMHAGVHSISEMPLHSGLGHSAEHTAWDRMMPSAAWYCRFTKGRNGGMHSREVAHHGKSTVHEEHQVGTGEQVICVDVDPWSSSRGLCDEVVHESLVGWHACPWSWGSTHVGSAAPSATCDERTGWH